MGMKNQVSSIKYQVLCKECILLCTLYLLLNTSLFAQQPTPPLIKKSEKIETIDGKKFYIHPVEKGQTLYSIAKTYSTTVDIILSNNQEAIDGLKAGNKLKIPFSGNTDAIKKEIEKQSSPKESSRTEPVQPKKEIVSKPSAKDTTSQKHFVVADSKNLTNVSLPSSTKDTTGIDVKYTMKNEADLNVAVFLPLALNSIDEINVDKISIGEEKMPEDVRTGIEFYEGVKFAFDSLKKDGFK